MCAEYTIQTRQAEIFNDFKDLKWNLPTNDFDLRIRGFLKTDEAPVIVFLKNEQPAESFLEIKPMVYSLCPAWSKVFPAPFSTYNARLERPDPKNNMNIQKIYDVATWKNPFKAQHCLIPMSGAIESSYFGTHAGQIVKFSKKDNSVFYALGIWDEWVNKNSGEIVSSFALLTDDPYEFFYETGHDRSIVVVNQDAQLKWLTESEKTPKAWFDFIKANRVDHQWQAETDRVMKDGWQKRAPNPLEILEIERFTPPLG